MITPLYLQRMGIPSESHKLAPPSLLTQARTMGSSVATWAVNGFQTATPEQLASRLDICKGCEFWNQTGFGGTGSCTKCGCSTQAKLRMATSRCPLDKWGDIAPQPI